MIRDRGYIVITDDENSQGQTEISSTK